MFFLRFNRNGDVKMGMFLKLIVVILALFAFVSPTSAEPIRYQTIIDGYHAPGFGVGATRLASKDVAIASCKHNNKNASAVAQKSCFSDKATLTVDSGMYLVLVYCKYRVNYQDRLRSEMWPSAGSFAAAFATIKQSMGAKDSWTCWMEGKLHNGRRF